MALEARITEKLKLLEPLAQVEGVGLETQRGLQEEASCGRRVSLTETEGQPRYLGAYGVATVPRKLGRVEEKRGPGTHCVG